MPTYRFYFISHGHSISEAKIVDCPGDAEAQRHAIDMLEAQSHDNAIEVWERGRFVARRERVAD
jgi:hypothetical protein